MYEHMILSILALYEVSVVSNLFFTISDYNVK